MGNVEEFKEREVRGKKQDLEWRMSQCRNVLERVKVGEGDAEADRNIKKIIRVQFKGMLSTLKSLKEDLESAERLFLGDEFWLFLRYWVTEEMDAGWKIDELIADYKLEEYV